MAEWSYFHPRLMPRVLGCPVPLANAELRAAAREFFERTRAWRQWLDPFTVYDGVRQYDLDPPIGSAVYRMEQATKDGGPFAVAAMNAARSDPSLHTGGDGLVSEDRSLITLLQDSTPGAVIQVQASLVPSDTSTGIPDHLASQFSKAILAGARFRLRTIANQPFSDSERASLDIAEFEAEIGRVQADVFRSHTNTTQRARPIWC